MADADYLLVKGEFVHKGLTYLPDTNRDAVGQLISRLNKLKYPNLRTTTFKAKAEIIRTLIDTMKEANYFFFTKNGNNYPNTVVGESYLCDVPQDRMGYLKPYRGQLVRILCYRSGENWRRDMAIGKVFKQ